MPDQAYVRQLSLQIQAIVGHSISADSSINQLFDSYAELALAKGARATDEDVHNAWWRWARIYRPTSPHLVPFQRLPSDIQAKDTRYRLAIQEVAKAITVR